MNTYMSTAGTQERAFEIVIADPPCILMGTKSSQGWSKSVRVNNYAVFLCSFSQTYPLLVDLPMLHCVWHVRSLNEVFYHNRSLAIHTSAGSVFIIVECNRITVLKRSGPAGFAKGTMLSVKNICRDDRVNYQLKYFVDANIMVSCCSKRCSLPKRRKLCLPGGIASIPSLSCRCSF